MGDEWENVTLGSRSAVVVLALDYRKQTVGVATRQTGGGGSSRHECVVNLRIKWRCRERSSLIEFCRCVGDRAEDRKREVVHLIVVSLQAEHVVGTNVV